MSDYNQKYQTQNYFGGGAAENVQKLLDYKKFGKVLDIGAGQGKNSLFLAKNGFEVFAVEPSNVGIKNLEQKIENLDIKTFNTSIQNFFTQNTINFDAVLAINSLQFISKDEIFEVLKNMQEFTNVGGINIIESFCAKNEEKKPQVLEKGRYVFSIDELKNLYSDWEVLFYEEKFSDWERHGDGPLHRHYLVDGIFRKK